MIAFLKQLNIKPRDVKLFETALTHSSFGNENDVENNERLEFLGDAVIELLISDYLYNESIQPEGVMTKRRAQAVREEALVIFGNKIGLDKHLRLGKGETIKGANNAMIADAFEAVFGACYLDLGLSRTKLLFDRVVVPNLKEVLKLKDFKSFLQEQMQSGSKRNISYQIIKESGPSHNKKFQAVVKLDNNIILGTGKGRTKKEAEQSAAKDAISKGTYND